jgi:hypothetical protein
MVARRLVLVATLAIVGAGAAACDDGGEPYSAGIGTPTVQTSATPQTTDVTAATPVPTSPNGPNENGNAPIFWRTTDNFESVVAGKAYLVLFRIESGYDEPSLSVSTTCTDCAADDVTFVGTNSPPIGQDTPGSYYPISFSFPQAGQWELKVHAGDDEVVIPVNVAAPA